VSESRRIYEGRVLNLRVDRVAKPRGGMRDVEIVEHAGGVVVIAQPEPGAIVLVRQYRFPVRDFLWEAPAGMLEPGEDPALAAARELQEETGYVAQRVEFLFSAYSSPGFCEEKLHFFAAHGLHAGPQHLDDIEEIDVLIWSLEDAWQTVMRDGLPDAKTQIALAWARQAVSS
jgi:ADP-ribose pyrophosphatase